jgi:hypothetical protein
VHLRSSHFSVPVRAVVRAESAITAFGHGFSWRDLILIAGGLFLVWKATKEIHHNVDHDPGPDLFGGGAAQMGFAAAIGQIILLDIVFSIDSIITAVGMTNDIPIMVIAVIVAVFLITYFVIRTNQHDKPSNPLYPILLGLFMLPFAGAPFWTTGLVVSLAHPASRGTCTSTATTTLLPFRNVPS